MSDFFPQVFEVLIDYFQKDYFSFLPIGIVKLIPHVCDRPVEQVMCADERSIV